MDGRALAVLAAEGAHRVFSAPVTVTPKSGADPFQAAAHIHAPARRIGEDGFIVQTASGARAEFLVRDYPSPEEGDGIEETSGRRWTIKGPPINPDQYQLLWRVELIVVR